MESANNYKSTYQLAKGVSVEYNQRTEYFGMYGPFVGKILVNGVKLDGLFTGPPRLSEDFRNLLIPKCELKYERKFIFKKEKVVFSILVIDLTTAEMFVSVMTFPLLFIEGMNGKVIIVHKANHNGIENNKVIVDFNTSNFRKIGLFNGKILVAT